MFQPVSTDRPANPDAAAALGSVRPRPLVLVVEADALTGLDLADALDRADCHVSGPFQNAAMARSWLERWTPGCAILDLPKLGHDGVLLAQDLRQRGVPFLVYSAHRREENDAAFEDVPWIIKPMLADDVVVALNAFRAR